MRIALISAAMMIFTSCQVCRIACTHEQTFVLTDGADNSLQAARVEVGGETFECGVTSERVRCAGNRVTVETFEQTAAVKITAQSGETWSGNLPGTGGDQQVASCTCVNTYPDVTVALSR